MPSPSLTPVRTLTAGARVALVAPAGPIVAADVERATANARSFGWEPVVGARVLDRYSYFAARDEGRLADLNAAIHADVDAIWCIRGGYGTMRILDGVDYDALRARPRPVMGYSDITALHAAIGRRAGIVAFHAPVARAELTPLARRSFTRALVEGTNPCGVAPEATTVRGGVARGRLAGGNLSLLAALAGTPYMPELRGAILVLEDVNEPLYRVDRMLMQLWLTGTLRNVAAIAFGYCTDCGGDETPDDARLSRSLDDVLREFADRARVPCVLGIPLGHVDEQWTIPLGATATLDADALTLVTGDD